MLTNKQARFSMIVQLIKFTTASTKKISSLLYGYFNEKELIAIFESLFDIGFDFNETSIIILNILHNYEFNHKYLDNSKFTQLMPCIYQKGIKPELIKYFINKFQQEMDNQRLQEEIVKILFHGIVYCQYSLIFFSLGYTFVRI